MWEVLDDGRSVLEGIVRKHHHDEHTGLVRHQVEGTGEGHGGARTGNDALFAVEPEAEVEGPLVGHLDKLVILVRPEELGLLELANAPHARDVVSLLRVHAVHLDSGVLLLQETSRPRNRPAGTEPGHEVRHLGLGLKPDLRARGLVVRLGIGFVPILIEHVEAGNLGQLVGFGDRALGSAGCGAKGVLQLDHVGAEEPQHRALLEWDGR